MEEMVTCMYQILCLFKYIIVKNAQQKTKQKYPLQVKPPKNGCNSAQSQKFLLATQSLKDFLSLCHKGMQVKSDKQSEPTHV